MANAEKADKGGGTAWGRYLKSLSGEAGEDGTGEGEGDGDGDGQGVLGTALSMKDENQAEIMERANERLRALVEGMAAEERALMAKKHAEEDKLTKLRGKLKLKGEKSLSGRMRKIVEDEVALRERNLIKIEEDAAKKKKKIKDDELKAEEDKNKKIIASNLRSLRTMFANTKGINKMLLALEKAHLLSTLVPRIRADAAAAFSATMKTSGFWGLAAAWTAFAMTAAQMGTAVASIRSMSTGGLVPGVAGAGDIVPAWLQPGEEVKTKSQVAMDRQAEAEAQASGDSPSIVRVMVEPSEDLGKMLQFIEEDRENEGF